MLSFGKSKRTVNLVIDDYVIRMIETNNKNIDTILTLAEKPIPRNMIDNGKLVDEPAFFDLMKVIVQDWGIKGRNVRFYVPQALIIMRELTLPENVKKDEQKQYITMEIGNTIHFPFKNPIFDLYEHNGTTDKVTILAAPENEVMKYTEILSDVSLHPIAADVQPIGIYRYYLHANGLLKNEQVHMFVEFNLAAVNISIFHQHQVEFLRHQPLTLTKDQWVYDDVQKKFIYTGDEAHLEGEIEDQLNEIDRLMNFYRFSIHQGNKSVTNLIVLGDSPHLDIITSKASERFQIPVSILKVEEQFNGQPIKSVFIPALGLALKGGK